MKIITKFLIYLMIALVALPAMILISPVKAQAATKTAKPEPAPVTQLVTAPDEPNENGWFDQVTLIRLKSNKENKTYFQWNTTEGEWQKFGQTMRAWRGSNILYYYSENRDGTKEAIKSQAIKVDYERPVVLPIQADGHNGQVRLSWPESPDIVSYRISKDDDFLASVAAEPTFYIDQNVKVDQTYIYKLKAIDQAGLKSKSIKTSVTVAAPLVKTEIQPAIDEGIAIVALPKKVEAKEEKVEPKQETPPVVTGEPSPVKNWNRLFVAISILIIAAGAAIAGYYGYEWWMARRETEEKPHEKKTSSRW